MVINPLKNEVSFKDIEIESNSSDKLVKWTVSCVCASERRRFNKQKSHSDLTPFIAGHESVGVIEESEDLHILLPHSNCLTRSDKILCASCREGSYNLCKCMNHAGLASSEPGGLSQISNVPESQLLECKDLDPELAVFTEPLSCVIRSWKKTSECDKKKIGIVGLGPIGCLHFLYGKIKHPDAEFYLFEENKERADMFNKAFEGFDYVINESVLDLDFTIMANSVSAGFEKAKNYLRKDGSLLLFSGFNEVNYNTNGLFPEFIHREEFNFYDDNIFLFGSSGYQREDLEDSMNVLRENSQFLKIVTGKVNGIDSTKLNSTYTTDQSFNRPVLIEDISGNLSHHIKIQYYVNNSE
mgnify:FL=1